MKTWLYLTADGLTHSTVAWPCCRWTSTGKRQLLPLSQAAQVLAGQAVDLLLPMELCSWMLSDPWPSRRQPDARAIAFAVEEQLSEVLERLHLSTGARDSQGRYPVLVIDRERFTAVLALLAEVGLEVRSVFVDADVWPGDQGLGFRWFGRGLLGGGCPARLAVSDDGLLALKPGLPMDVQWRDERQDCTDIDQWLTSINGQAINLLHGDFAAPRKRLPWRLGGLVVLALLLLDWGASQARIGFLESQSHQLYSRNEQQFKTLYPDQTRIVDLALQLNALQSPNAAPQDGQIAGLVKLVEQVIGASNADVQRIEFREGDGWKVRLTANSFTELELLRERGRQQGLPVRLDSASKEGDRVQATLTLEQGT